MVDAPLNAGACYLAREPERGHRKAIMSIDGNYTNVGIAVVPETNAATRVGPQVITGNFSSANTAAANHFNRFIVGTVWEDSNSNGQYDPGEGLAGVTVMPDKGTYYAVTANSGGYAIPVTAPGGYVVTFSGSMITIPETTTITVAATSVLLDLYYTGDSTVPEANTGRSVAIDATSAVLNGTVSPNGLTTTYYFEYGTTTAYGLVTASWTTDADASVSATVDALSAQTTYHYRLVATNSSGTSYGSDRSFQTASTYPAPSSGGGGGGTGCFLTTAAAGMDPAAPALLAGAIGASAVWLALLSRRRRGSRRFSPSAQPTPPIRVLKNSA